MSSIWREANGPRRIGPLAGTLLRIVESQAQVATAKLVDRLDKQALLEDLLESTKPVLRQDKAGLHYLLATPFRYPPLRHGSRFGRRSEPSLLYGSLALPTLLAEAAYYRFLFWSGMAEPPPQRLTSQHAVFEARYATEQGLQLQSVPFDRHRTALRDPADYSVCQALGSAMRSAGVEAFEFVSAREVTAGLNVALYTPTALADQRPGHTEQWLAETTADQVSFHSQGAGMNLTYPRRQFEVDGKLPQPAG
jgi:hypothetical protein